MYKFLKSFQRLLEVKKSGGKLYIRCASKIGRNLYEELKKIGISIDAFLDLNYVEHKVYDGVPILDPKQVYRGKRNFFILIAMGDFQVYKEIVKELDSVGLVATIDYCDFSINPDERMYSFLDIYPNYNTKELFRSVAIANQKQMKFVDDSFCIKIPDEYNLIPNLDVPVTTYCSLNCKFCSHCIPYASPPKHFDAEDIISDLSKLISVSYIACLAIMGGEPFVYPHLDKFLDLYCQRQLDKKIGFTRLITNGTVIPKDDFFHLFKKISNAYIYISNYGPKSKKISELISKCIDFDVNYYLCSESEQWKNLGNFSYSRDYSKQDISHLFSVCEARTCFQLFNGKFYSCPRIPVLNEYGLIPESSSDFCNVRESNELVLKDNLHEYMYKKEYLDGCMFCDGQHMYSERVKRGV